jgi:hypothetical protein
MPWQRLCIIQKMNSIFNFLLVFILIPFTSISQLNCVWSAQKKISLNNYGYCVSTGPEGNVYVSGAFSGPYRNPGPQDMGCFLTCHNSQGLEIWHKEFYSSIGAIAAFNKVDSKGNIILAGPGILKYNSQGILLVSCQSLNVGDILIEYSVWTRHRFPILVDAK